MTKPVVGALATLIVLVAVFAAQACRPFPTLPPATPTPSPETPQPTPIPTVVLADRDVGRGDEVIVLGEGWPAGAAIVIELLDLFEDEDGADAQIVATAVADEDGGFEASFDFPAEGRWEKAPGAFVRARVVDFGQDAVAVLRLREVDETPEPSPTPTEEPSEPTATPTTTPVPTPVAPTPTVGCTDRVAFVRDVTIPDSSLMQTGQVFIKTWRLRNSGTCTWTTDYALAYKSGHRLGGVAAVPLGTPVAPGATVDLSVSLVAPAEHGVFQGYWMLRNASGREFGTGPNANGTFWVRIRVGPIPTPTPVATPVITAWRGDYYANPDLAGAPKLTRNDSAINFDWGRGAPAAGLPSDNFSVRWTRTLWFDQGLYRFHAIVDDGVRVYLDGALVIDSWRDGGPREVTGDIAVAAGYHGVRVEYYERTGDARIQVWWDKVSTYPDWRGEYWSNRSLSGSPALVRNDPTIDFDWKRGAPAPGLPADNFSARWTREVTFDGGTYRFLVGVDDGARLWINDKLIIDTWRDGSYREVTADYALAAGKHQVRLEYYENLGDARIRLAWEKVTSFPDWKGEYWSNRKLSGTPALVRNDAKIDFNWKLGAPAPGLPADGFSARWTRDVTFEGATYRFFVGVDDGARLWIDDQLIIDTWRDGSYREVTADHALVAGKHRVRLEYYENLGDARVRLAWEKVASPSYPDWKGEYWSNRKLSGAPALVRNDRAIDLNWGAGSPAPGLPADNFSARWTRQQKFDEGVYRINARADDGVRVYLDGELVIDEWHDSPGGTTYSVDVPITAGKHTLRVEYYERTGLALVKVWWKRVGDLPTPTPEPNGPPVAVDDTATTDQDTPVAINVLANDTDPDGDDLVVSAFSPTSAEGGVVSCTAAGWCTYTPPPGFVGDDSFTYTVSDGQGGSDTATVSVEVKAVVENSPPAAVDDEVVTEEGVAVLFNVLANDKDTDGDRLAILSYDRVSAQGGAVRCRANGWCRYAPARGFSGGDHFSYVVGDGRGGSASGLVSIEVEPAPSEGGDVVINELLPAPELGAAGAEWIELYNVGDELVDLGGWALDNGEGGGGPYLIPAGTVIEAGGFLVFDGVTTGIDLADSGGQVRLLRPDGTLVDAVAFGQLPVGATYSRGADGVWHADWPASPGKPNSSDVVLLQTSARLPRANAAVGQLLTES